MKAINMLLETAKNEIGYVEKASNSNLDDKTANAGSNNYTKYARDLDKTKIYNGSKNGYAWCDVFVDWCFVKTFGFEKGIELTCQPLNSCGAGCTYSAEYYKSKNQFHVSNPKPGDQIFFTKDGGKTSYHTGIVVEVTNGKVYTVEGNTDSSSGVVANGGSVNLKSYSISSSYIGGYGRPDYSIIKLDNGEVAQTNIIDENMFSELYDRMRQSLRDNDASEYSKEARDWAINNEFIKGAMNLNGEDNNYMWEDFLTREQFVTVLYRFVKDFGLLEKKK